MFFYDKYYWLLVIPAMIIAIAAQYRVSRTYDKYSRVLTAKGCTAADITRKILNLNGLGAVRIECISGKLTDHYDPRGRVIRLSQAVYNSTSCAAIGVAAHEAGHAVQYAQGYLPIKIKSAILPITTISSRLSIPIAILGFIFGITWLVDIGITLFCAVLLFQLITLPIEYNASNRAVASLRDDMQLSGDELNGAEKVLSAAALTYVAALIGTAANLLRLILLRENRR